MDWVLPADKNCCGGFLSEADWPCLSSLAPGRSLNPIPLTSTISIPPVWINIPLDACFLQKIIGWNFPPHYMCYLRHFSSFLSLAAGQISLPNSTFFCSLQPPQPFSCFLAILSPPLRNVGGVLVVDHFGNHEFGGMVHNCADGYDF